METSVKQFGTLPDGRVAYLYQFKTKNGMEVSITNYGGAITSVKVPGSNGVVQEVTAGFPTLDGYLGNHPHFGVLVGRYANRIAKGSFTIDGNTFTLPINNGPNHLHGGDNGFHRKLWEHNLKELPDGSALELSCVSPHLDQGYPGELTVRVTYTILQSNEIRIEYYAVTSAATHVNLTSHVYFNLNGFTDDVMRHMLSINAYGYTPVDANQIPTGEIRSAEGTPYGFSIPKAIGSDFDLAGPGYDHNFVLNQPRCLSTPAATVYEPASGRTLTVYTTQPGIQLYTGNSLDGSVVGHNGVAYAKNSAFCLETQHFPDTPNKPQFPSTLLRVGEEYSHFTRFIFGVKA